MVAMGDRINWQSAVGVLEAERGRAISAAALIRRVGDAGEVTRAELIYGEGMAEANAMIGTLMVAVGQGTVDDIDGVEKRLAKAATPASGSGSSPSRSPPDANRAERSGSRRT